MIKEIKILSKNASTFKGYGWCGTYMNDDISEPQFNIQADSGKLILSNFKLETGLPWKP